MREVLNKEDEELKSKILSIRENMECWRGFECLRNGFENLCGESNFSGGDYPECREKADCPFKSEYGYLYLCTCPLRMDMFSRI